MHKTIKQLEDDEGLEVFNPINFRASVWIIKLAKLRTKH